MLQQPIFALDQNDEFLLVQITVKPSLVDAKKTEAEMEIEGSNTFTFHVAPYFIRLQFQHKLLNVDDEGSQTKVTLSKDGDKYLC